MKEIIDLADRYKGALVGTAVGDALGAPTQGRHQVPAAYLDSLDEPDRLVYTDDTAMTIGVVRSFAECGGFDGEHMTETLWVVSLTTQRPEAGHGGPGPDRRRQGGRAS